MLVRVCMYVWANYQVSKLIQHVYWSKDHKNIGKRNNSIQFQIIKNQFQWKWATADDIGTGSYSYRILCIFSYFPLTIVNRQIQFTSKYLATLRQP